MKRIIFPVILAAAALFLFTGCGYDFLFGGELSVTLTASSDIDLWYHEPTLHLKSGGNQIDEKMTASAAGESAWVTVSHLNDGDWDIWITLDDFPDWESAGTTVKVESRGMTAVTGAVSLGTGGLPDFRWDVYGEVRAPQVSIDAITTRLCFSRGNVYNNFNFNWEWNDRTIFGLRGDFTEYGSLAAAYPDGIAFDTGARYFNGFNIINVDAGDIRVITPQFHGPGPYTVLVRDTAGLSAVWTADIANPEGGFEIASFVPSASFGPNLTFTIDGDAAAAAGYLLVHYINGASEVAWVAAPTGTETYTLFSNPTSGTDGLYIGVFDMAPEDPAVFEADISAVLSSFTTYQDAEGFLRTLGEFSQDYLIKGTPSYYISYMLSPFES